MNTSSAPLDSQALDGSLVGEDTVGFSFVEDGVIEVAEHATRTHILLQATQTSGEQTLYNTSLEARGYHSADISLVENPPAYPTGKAPQTSYFQSYPFTDTRVHFPYVAFAHFI